MPRPAVDPPVWATDLNYTSPPKAGTPTKSDPGAGKRAEGHLPEEQPPPQEFNFDKNAIGQWLNYLRDIDFFNFMPVNPQEFSLSTIDEGEAGGLAFKEDVNHFSVPTYRYAIAFLTSSELFLSVDGLSWTQVTSIGTFTGVDHSRSIFFSSVAGLWIIGTTAGSTDRILTAVDADLTWTVRTDPSTSATHGGIAEGAGIIVMPTIGIITSPDGITWTSRTDPTTAGNLRACVFSPELTLFVIVGDNGAIASSADGITWTDRSIGAGVQLKDVTWDSVNGAFVAVGLSQEVHTSPDGITWTDRSIGLTFDDSLKTVVSHGGGAVTMTGTGHIFLSNDGGVTWIAQRKPSNLTVAPNVAYFDNRLILFGGSPKSSLLFGYSIGVKTVVTPTFTIP